MIIGNRNSKWISISFNGEVYNDVSHAVQNDFYNRNSRMRKAFMAVAPNFFNNL